MPFSMGFPLQVYQTTCPQAIKAKKLPETEFRKADSVRRTQKPGMVGVQAV